MAVVPVVLISELLGLVLASITSGALYHVFVFGVPGDWAEFASLGALASLLVLSLFYMRGLYQTARLLSGRFQVSDVVLIWIAVFLVLAVLGFGFKSGASFSRGFVFLFFSVGLVTLIGQRYVWKQVLSHALDRGALRTKKVVLLGTPDAWQKDSYDATLKRHAVEIVRRFPLPFDAHRSNVAEVQNAMKEILSFLRGSEVEEVLLVGDWAQWCQMQALLSELRAVPLPVRLLPEGNLAELIGRPLTHLGTTHALELQRAPLDGLERTLKRMIDLVFAGLGVLALSPLLLLAALAVRLDSRGPVIFRQTRLGFNGLPFQIYKFRTMTVLENGPSIVQAQRNDQRVTRVGRWLRRTSIDELPQLFNVLKRDMSLVGPRPHALAHDNYYDRLIANYAYRQHVKPGITGWAQVNGCRGETATVELMGRRVELDLWYVANWSFWLDVRIIAQTAIALIFKRDVY
jgi:Undecaprenyl-phosphate glucose phosphotransferase